MEQDTRSISSTILIVDDNKKNLQVLGNILHGEGYKIAVAQDGYQAIKLAEKIKPELILMDVMMPGIDGFEACLNLKSKKELKDIPVVFLTAKSETTDIIEGFRNGGVDYITKPFKKEELLARVKTHMDLENARKILKIRADELKAANAGKDRLFSIIAHDLRHPLANLKSLLELLLFDYDRLTKENIIRCFKEIKDSTDETYNLLQNLLQWSQNEMGNLSYKPVPFILSDSVNSSIKLFKQSSEKKNITIDYDPENNLKVFADKDMIETILRNLINNAIKFSFENSSVIITEQMADGKAELKIQDFGTGISENNKKELLDKSKVVTTRGTKNEKGTGVGLNLCYEFAEKNSGRLWFESKEGKGSTFYFTLPLKK